AYTAKDVPALCQIPERKRAELLAAVHDDTLAERRCRRLVRDGHIRGGLDQRVDPQGQAELIATARDRMPNTFLDRGEPVTHGSLVNLEQRARRRRVLTQAE